MITAHVNALTDSVFLLEMKIMAIRLPIDSTLRTWQSDV